MLTIRNILFPTDFSPKTSRALDISVDLALAHRAQLHFLHVVEPVTDEPYDETDDDLDLKSYYVDAIRAATEWMDPFVARAIRKGCVLPQRSVLRGEVARSIAGYAAARNIDVIVLPCRTERVPGAFTVSGRVGNIIRSAPCPVLTLRDAVVPRSISRIDDILVAVDFSGYSRLAIQYAARIGKSYGARLHALHVIPRERVPECYLPAVGSRPVPEAGATRHRAHDSLQYFIREMDLLEVPISTMVKTDNPAFGISDYAREIGADLIVMGAHGQSGYTVSGPGSIAGKVIRLAACPVLTVRHKKKQVMRSARMLELATDLV